MATRRMPGLLALAVLAAGVAWWTLRGGAPADDAELAARIEATCSRCHAFTPPGILPRSAWRLQIEHMAFLESYLPEAADGPAVAPPAVETIVAWYEARAPERLPLAGPVTRDEPPPLRLSRRSVRLGASSGPGVASVRRVDDALAAEGGPVLAAANMATGTLHLVSAQRGPRLVGRASHPARVVAGDFDRDGRIDLAIGDLGDSLPNEDPLGRVLIARGLPDGSFEMHAVAVELGRVADVLALDLDADGDLDLLAAAFGFLRTGGIHALYNETPEGGPLAFRSVQITDKVGSVSVVRFDEASRGDRPGFAVAFAQHHEVVSVFEPEGDGYRERIVYRAPHPAWGTSHLASVDLDADGDTDFLLSNGDSLDDGVAFKPYHGVTWLENRGDDGFEAQRVGALHGALGAEAADLDADGDLDVVAVGFLPQLELPVPEGAMRVDSVVWFERSAEGWIPWSIEADHPRHTGVTIVDFDGDGRLDVVAGINRAWDVEEVEIGPSLEIWFNEGPVDGSDPDAEP